MTAPCPGLVTTTTLSVKSAGVSANDGHIAPAPVIYRRHHGKMAARERPVGACGQVLVPPARSDWGLNDPTAATEWRFLPFGVLSHPQVLRRRHHLRTARASETTMPNAAESERLR